MQNLFDQIRTLLAMEELCAANDGRWPTTRSDMLRLAARFGCDVRFHPPPFKGSESRIDGEIIDVPEIPDGESMTQYHRHELLEAMQRWEGRAPCVDYRAAAATPHEIARRLCSYPNRIVMIEDLTGRFHPISFVLMQREL